MLSTVNGVIYTIRVNEILSKSLSPMCLFCYERLATVICNAELAQFMLKSLKSNRDPRQKFTNQTFEKTIVTDYRSLYQFPLTIGFTKTSFHTTSHPVEVQYMFCSGMI